MAKGLKHGTGGGSPLNFKVVGGTSAPSDPKENTIWVNTDAEITSWAFSATEPKTPAAGMVWISVGVSSPTEFNALKKNNLTVYPMSAKQYVGGAWVAKGSSSYQSGAWKSAQNIIVPNTGTVWTKSEGTASASKTTSATTISITTKASANGTATDSAIYTELDATQYSTFYVKGSYTINNTTTSSQVYKIQLLNSSGSAISTIVNKTVSKGTNTGAVAFEKTIDLTSVTGKCKLMFTATTYTTESLTFATTISSCKAY